jgi:hypothetical protein
MDDDRRVKPLSNAEVRQHAKRLRKFFGLEQERRIDLIACLKSSRIWTVRGELPLAFHVRPDAELKVADAKTTTGKNGVLIEMRQSVFERLKVGEGRTRNTAAHELGHGVLHDGAEMPRLARGNVTPSWIPPYESSEHQVKVFAPAFLINDQVAETLQGASEVAIEFGISLESADIYYEKLLEQREREQTAKKIRSFADEFAQAAAAPSTPKLHYLSEPCHNCGNPTVFPVGNKFMCQTCNATSERLQDGDPGFGS